jgi:hypothetical protein
MRAGSAIVGLVHKGSVVEGRIIDGGWLRTKNGAYIYINDFTGKKLMEPLPEPLWPPQNTCNINGLREDEKTFQKEPGRHSTRNSFNDEQEPVLRQNDATQQSIIEIDIGVVRSQSQFTTEFESNFEGNEASTRDDFQVVEVANDDDASDGGEPDWNVVSGRDGEAATEMQEHVHPSRQHPSLRDEDGVGALADENGYHSVVLPQSPPPPAAAPSMISDISEATTSFFADTRISHMFSTAASVSSPSESRITDNSIETPTNLDLSEVAVAHAHDRVDVATAGAGTGLTGHLSLTADGNNDDLRTGSDMQPLVQPSEPQLNLSSILEGDLREMFDVDPSAADGSSSRESLNQSNGPGTGTGTETPVMRSHSGDRSVRFDVSVEMSDNGSARAQRAPRVHHRVGAMRIHERLLDAESNNNPNATEFVNVGLGLLSVANYKRREATRFPASSV